MSEVKSWPPLESNPQVLNDFAYKCGVSHSWEFVDVFGLDEELLGMIPQPSLAFLFLFPSKAKTEYQESSSGKEKCFFLHQIPLLDQACGTIAMIHAIANNLSSLGLKDGPIFRYIENTQNSTPNDRGFQLAANEELSKLHTSYSQQGQTEALMDGQDSDHHFVCFTTINGRLYELDGLKATPTDHGEVNESTFLHKVATVIQKTYLTDPSLIDFSMMSLSAAMQDE
jgi:ubiquitin carboxyl-terminal hydrolase L3